MPLCPGFKFYKMVTLDKWWFHYLINCFLTRPLVWCLNLKSLILFLHLRCTFLRVNSIHFSLPVALLCGWTPSKSVSHSPREILISALFSWVRLRMLWSLIEMQRNRSLEYISQDQVKEEKIRFKCLSSIQFSSLIYPNEKYPCW